MKENQILVMIKRPGQEPEIEPLFDNTLEAFQEAVGGYIETYPVEPGCICICNEEGKLLGLPYNVTIRGEDLVGTLVFCGTKGPEVSSLKAVHIPMLRDLLEV